LSRTERHTAYYSVLYDCGKRFYAQIFAFHLWFLLYAIQVPTFVFRRKRRSSSNTLLKTYPAVSFDLHIKTDFLGRSKRLCSQGGAHVIELSLRCGLSRQVFKAIVEFSLCYQLTRSLLGLLKLIQGLLRKPMAVSCSFLSRM